MVNFLSFTQIEIDLNCYIHFFELLIESSDFESKYTQMNVLYKSPKRTNQSVVFNSVQKMALRVFYTIRTLTKALTYIHKPLSAPSFGRNSKQPMRKPYWEMSIFKNYFNYDIWHVLLLHEVGMMYLVRNH